MEATRSFVPFPSAPEPEAFPIINDNLLTDRGDELFFSISQQVVPLVFNASDWVLLINGLPISALAYTAPGTLNHLFGLQLSESIAAPITATVQYTRTTSSIQNVSGDELADLAVTNIILPI